MRPLPAAVVLAALVVVPPPFAHTQAAPVTVERVGQWGCEMCETGHQFAEIAALALAPNGTFYLIDRDEPRVRVFAADGALIRAFARRGQGPGELETPAGVALLSDGSLLVPDLRNSRLTRFGSDGAVLGSAPLRALPTAIAGHPSSTHVWLALTEFRSGAIVERRRPDGLEAILSVSMGGFPPAEHGMSAIHSMAASGDGGVAIGDGATEYRIRRLDVNGRPAGPDIVREIPRTKRSAEEIAELQAQMARRGEQMRQMMNRERAGAGSAVRMPAIPPFRNHFNFDALQYDDEGRLWVRTERGAAGRTIFDVFDTAGRLLGEVELPIRSGKFSIAGAHLVTTTSGEDDVPMIALWRVRWR